MYKQLGIVYAPMEAVFLIHQEVNLKDHNIPILPLHNHPNLLNLLQLHQPQMLQIPIMFHIFQP